VAEIHTNPTLPYRLAQTETYAIAWRVSSLSIQNGKQPGQGRWSQGSSLVPEEEGKSITDLYREFGLPCKIEGVPARDGRARSAMKGRVS
jgi:hypothetical protein